MKKTLTILSAAFFLAISNLAQALETNAAYISVPFVKELSKNEPYLQAQYKFDPHTQAVICEMKEGNAIVNGHWMYKGVPQSKILPLRLEDHERANNYADPDGYLYLQVPYADDLGESKVKVSCSYVDL